MASAIRRSLSPISMIAAHNHTASLIFLHGSGDTGPGAKYWLADILDKDFAFPHVKVLFPTAPRRPYSLYGGIASNVWFDRHVLSLGSEEDIMSMDAMCDTIDAVVQHEVNQGIPRSRIMLGGFSMGGAMAMYYGYQRGLQLAGIFAMSSFLNSNSKVYQKLQQQEGRTPPLFLACGTADTLVLPSWTIETHSQMTKLGVKTEFHKYPDTAHEMIYEEIQHLQKWIDNVLPPISQNQLKEAE